MKCIILAAGYATRLYPLTENFPKPLLKVGEKTILDWLIDDIDSSGKVDKYVVVANHKYAPIFEKWAPGHRTPIKILDDGTNSNETRLGAVRDIQFAVDECSMGEGEDILVIAGDNLLDFSLSKFIDYSLSKGTSCVMRFREDRPEILTRTGVASVDEEDRILLMEEKPVHPKGNWCIPPFYFYRKEDVHLISEGISRGCGVDAPGSFIAWLSTVVPVHAFLMPGRRYDIGNMQSYLRAQEEYPRLILG